MNQGAGEVRHGAQIAGRAVLAKTARFRWPVLFLFSVLGGVLGGTASWFALTEATFGGAAVYAALAGALLYLLVVSFSVVALERLNRKVKLRDELQSGAETLQEHIEDDFFNNLVKINFKYIDKYYLQTQIQADKAFLMSAIAGFVGLLILAAGIVQMYVAADREPGYVTTAAGVLSEFIASIFFFLYNKTVVRMADYHRKLVLTQNISLALRITQDMPEQNRLAAQEKLIDRLTSDVNLYLSSSDLQEP